MDVKIEADKIKLLKDDELLFDMGFFMDEFICNFYCNWIVIEEDSLLYNKIKQLMMNEYLFDNRNLSNKSKNKLTFLSDQYGDLDDINQTELMSRMVIGEVDDKFIFFSYKPYFTKNQIKKFPISVILSSGGNGNYSKNKKTNSTFQTDFINIMYNSFFDDKEKILMK